MRDSVGSWPAPHTSLTPAPVAERSRRACARRLIDRRAGALFAVSSARRAWRGLSSSYCVQYAQHPRPDEPSSTSARTIVYRFSRPPPPLPRKTRCRPSTPSLATITTVKTITITVAASKSSGDDAAAGVALSWRRRCRCCYCRLSGVCAIRTPNDCTTTCSATTIVSFDRSATTPTPFWSSWASDSRSSSSWYAVYSDPHTPPHRFQPWVGSVPPYATGFKISVVTVTYSYTYPYFNIVA